MAYHFFYNEYLYGADGFKAFNPSVLDTSITLHMSEFAVAIGDYKMITPQSNKSPEFPDLSQYTRPRSSSGKVTGRASRTRTRPPIRSHPRAVARRRNRDAALELGSEHMGSRPRPSSSRRTPSRTISPIVFAPSPTPSYDLLDSTQTTPTSSRPGSRVPTPRAQYSTMPFDLVIDDDDDIGMGAAGEAYYYDSSWLETPGEGIISPTDDLPEMFGPISEDMDYFSDSTL